MSCADMPSTKNKHDNAEPFHRSLCRRRTSAEIVGEARKSLRTLCTQRPFTPRDEQRWLFGPSSSQNPLGRPPSSFSLHTHHFETPESRPSSGKRLSPLEHKPALPWQTKEGMGDLSATPRPPPCSSEVQGGSKRRSRLLRSTSLPGFTLLAAGKDGLKSSTTGPSPQVSTGKIRVSSAGSGVKAGSQRVISEGVPTGTTATADESEESFYWNTRVKPILQELKTLAPEANVDGLCLACDRLLATLLEGEQLGRKCKQRSLLLRTLFQLVDIESDKLSLRLATLALQLRVSGNNLLNISKLVYKISRREENDALFYSSAIVDCLLVLLSGEDIWSMGETLLYTVATLKFLSGNPTLLRELQIKGVVPRLLQLTHRLSQDDVLEPGRLIVSAQVLLQLTATLRNLADLSESRAEFLSRPGLPELCSILLLHSGDAGVCTNVARILSKLSSYHECCLVLASHRGCYSIFLRLLLQHQKQTDLVVRILFTLGNLTAKSDKAREHLFSEEGSIEVLLHLFQTYSEEDVVSKPGDDVLVKLLRVLANLAVSSVPGYSLADEPRCQRMLINLLEHRSVETNAELVVNAAATINNLSFYQTEHSVSRAQLLPVASLMVKLLLSTNMDAVLEATRVLGNLSQCRAVRNFILEKKVHRFMVLLLDSKQQNVCYSACGILTNLTVDKRQRAQLREEAIIQKLLDCLRDWGAVDWQLATLVCHVLCNYTKDGKDCFTEEETYSLLRLLTAYMDKELVLQWSVREGTRDEVNEFQHDFWRTEFLPVAQRLRKQLQTWHGGQEPNIAVS